MKLNKTKFAVVMAMTILLSACGGSHSEQNELTCFPFNTIEVREEEDGMNEYVVGKMIDVQSGKELFSIEGKIWTPLKEGYALADCGDGFMSFVDKKGEKKFGPYVSATEFSEGIAFVAEENGRIKAINTKGKELFTLEDAEDAACFIDGVAMYSDSEGKLWIVDRKGKSTMLNTVNKNINPFFINGMLLSCEPSEGGTEVTRIFDKKGGYTDLPYGIYANMTEEEDFSWTAGIINPMMSGKLIASKNDKFGVTTIKGEWLINPQFDGLWQDGDMYLFKKGGKYGWCDKKGTYVITPNYSKAQLFGNGDFAAVKDRDGWKYINKKGEMAIDGEEYRSLLPFTKSGIAFVQDSSRDYGAIDKDGRYVINPQYDNVWYLSDNRFLVKSENEYGIIDEKGKSIMNMLYGDFDKNLIGSYQIIGIYRAVAFNQFVDYEKIAEALKEASSAVVETTAGQLKESGVKESAFSKNGGYVTVKELKGKLYDIKVKTWFNAWSRQSDGWFGYNYIFNSNAKNGKYIISLELKDKAEYKSDVMFKSFSAPVTVSEDEKNISIAGKSYSIEQTDRYGNRFNFTFVN